MPIIQSKKRKREFSGGAQNQKQFLSLEPRQDDQFNSSSSSRPITSGQGLPTSTAKGCNDIVNIGSLGNLLSQIAVCVKCRGSLSVSTGSRVGLGVNIVIRCNICSFEVSSTNSTSLPESKHLEVFRSSGSLCLQMYWQR